MIQFMRHYRQYNAGEVAVFSSATEDHLIKSKVAIACATRDGVATPSSKVLELSDDDDDDLDDLDDNDEDGDDKDKETGKKPDPHTRPTNRQTTTQGRGGRGRGRR